MLCSGQTHKAQAMETILLCCLGELKALKQSQAFSLRLKLYLCTLVGVNIIAILNTSTINLNAYSLCNNNY